MFFDALTIAGGLIAVALAIVTLMASGCCRND